LHIKCWLENLKGREHAEDLGVNGKNVRKDLREIGLEGVNWMHPSQDRDQCWALVNTVTNFRVPQKVVRGEIS
jgi:hypothetical protein